MNAFLGVIPLSWSIVELQNCVEIHYGKSLPAKERKQTGQIPVVGFSGVVGRHNASLVDGPSLSIGRKGAAGSVHFISESSWPIDTAFFIQPPDGLNIRWLNYYLGSCELGQLEKSTAIPSLSRDDLYRVKIPVAPVAEQARIVEKLEELLSDLDAGVAELKAAQAKLVRYRQSLLKAAVEGALTAEWRQHNTPRETGAQLLQRILSERRTRWEAKQLAKFAEQCKAPPKDWQKKYPEPVQPDTRDLPELPEEWVWASLDQLTAFITSGSRGWADYYSTHGAIFIRSQNINKDWLDLSDAAFVIPPRNSEGLRTSVQKHDLLLTITGANVGKAACVEITLKEAYVSQHVALIRPVKTTLVNFIHLFLTSSSGGRGQLNKEAYGAGKPGLNLQQVGSVHIPLPSQAEFARLMETLRTQLDSISEQDRFINRLIKQSTAQRKNILRAAFAGQLVPQDPNDEPASALLARIRAERTMREQTDIKSRATKTRRS